MTTTNQFFDRLAGVWQNKIDGKWQDSFGWNFITQPKLGVPGGSDFEMRVDRMRETIEFKKLSGLARNVGITGEAGFWQAMSYEISIVTPGGDGIHQEMGHFLLRTKEDGETPENLVGDVIRQATIPRANAIMTTGILKPGTIAAAVNDQDTPFYDAKPRTSDESLQVQIDAVFAAKHDEITNENGPNFERPLEWLATILAGPAVDPDWVFAFRDDRNPSQMASGQRVVNPVSIGNLLSDFWIGNRKGSDGTIETLQYVQTVDLIFHGIRWPHVALNSLVKQS